MLFTFILIALLIALIAIKLTYWLKSINYTRTSFLRSFFRFYPQHRIYTTSTQAKSRFMKANNAINIIFFIGLVMLFIVIYKFD